MIVAVNLSGFVSGRLNHSMCQYFLELAGLEKDHRFILIFSREVDKPRLLPKNCSAIISRPAFNVPAFWKFWYNYTLPGLIRKHKIQRIVHTGGACSLRVNIEQWTILNELFFANPPLLYSPKQVHFIKRNSALFISKTSKILAGSKHHCNLLTEQYQIEPGKVDVLPPIFADGGTSTFDEKEKIKEQHADGKEFFVYHGTIHNNEEQLTNLLKAFSFFKKRQKSNMQLLLLPDSSPGDASFVNSLKTYKYKSELKYIKDLPSTSVREIIGAAYAFVYPLGAESFPFVPAQALHSGIPLVLTNHPVFREVGGDAAVYVDNSSYMDIANHMMLLFKDETLRSGLIAAAHTMNQQLGKKQAGNLWQAFFHDEHPHESTGR